MMKDSIRPLSLFFNASALFYGLTGVSLLFFPEEVLAYLKLNADTLPSLILQLTGTLYLGFAFLNYTSAKSQMDFVFLKPVVATNLGHALMAGLTLVNALGDLAAPYTYLIGLLCLTYLLIGLMCGRLIFKPPAKPKHV